MIGEVGELTAGYVMEPAAQDILSTLGTAALNNGGRETLEGLGGSAAVGAVSLGHHFGDYLPIRGTMNMAHARAAACG